MMARYVHCGGGGAAALSTMISESDVIVDEIRQIAAHYSISYEESDEIHTILHNIGDELRSERLRNELGQTNLPQLCLRILHESSIANRLEALRILANLCVDHGM